VAFSLGMGSSFPPWESALFQDTWQLTTCSEKKRKN